MAPSPKSKTRIVVLEKKHIKNQLMADLMLAHKRLAETGTATDVIKLSRYLLRLIDKEDDTKIILD